MLSCSPSCSLSHFIRCPPSINGKISEPDYFRHGVTCSALFHSLILNFTTHSHSYILNIYCHCVGILFPAKYIAIKCSSKTPVFPKNLFFHSFLRPAFWREWRMHVTYMLKPFLWWWRVIALFRISMKNYCQCQTLNKWTFFHYKPYWRWLNNESQYNNFFSWCSCG